MLGMIRKAVVLALLLSSAFPRASGEKPAAPSFDSDVARTHEIKPHRHTIPMVGVSHGFNQLHLTLTVSAAGEVMDAKADGSADLLKLWPKLKGEVHGWKFTPFEEKGKAVTAVVEEYINLVPPEQLPTAHLAAPELRPDSKVSISLKRSGCYGTCPVYTVTLSTTDGIEFFGRSYVAFKGEHTAKADADAVRKLAREFVAADFYSMDAEYIANVTDLPTCVLSISIDGHEKKVEDYAGTWVGMPAVIKDLEEEVDAFAGSQKWVKGSDEQAPRER